MRLGLGLSLASVGGGASFLDLSTLAWTGWWDGDNYNATTGTATGKASAGSSGGRNLTEATTKPTKGNAVNGYNGIILNGTDQKLNTALTLGDFIANNASYFVAVAKVTAAGSGGPDGYVNAPIFADAGSYWSRAMVDVTGPKTTAYHIDTGSKICRSNMSNAVVHIIEIWHDGVDLSLLVDGAGLATVAAGNVHASGLAATLRFGTNWNQGAYLNGTVYEAALMNAAPASGTRLSVRQSLANKYGITLP